MKQSGNGYKLSKFVQKIFADFIVDGGAIGGTIQGLPVLSEGPVYLTG